MTTSGSKSKSKSSLGIRLVEGSAPWLVIGSFALMIAVLVPGCSQELRQRNARLSEENRRLNADHARTRSIIRKKGRMLGSLFGRLALAQQTASTHAARAGRLKARLEMLQAQVRYHRQEAQEAALRGRHKALAQCRSLPDPKTVKRRLRKRFRKPVVLARLSTARNMVLVVAERAGDGRKRVSAVYQDKTQPRLGVVPLIDAVPGSTALTVRIRSFLGRFVAVDVSARQRVDRQRDAVAVRHFILRPTARGAELACIARGNARMESRKTGVSTHARKVSFLPVPAAPIPTFQLEVRESGVPGASGSQRLGASRVPSYWTVALRPGGRCVMRQAVRRASKRNALEGLF